MPLKMLLVLLLAATAVRGQDARSPSTLTMIQRLRDIDANQDVLKNPYENRRRAALLARRIQKRQGDEANLIHNLGLELVRAGDSARALRAFKALRDGFAKAGLKTTPEQRAELRFYEITAWLRLAEQQNCLGHHGRESCLMPIRGSGVHVDRKASREAIRLLEKELKFFPDDLASRWLLNLAWMTLGGWPEEVPEQFRIPPETFASKAPMPRLLDVGREAGVAVLGLSGGAVTEDFDGDGLIDIMCSSWHLKDQIRFFRNKGDGTFEDITTAAGLQGLTGGLNLVHADYDNDGDFDVLVLRGAWRGPAGRWPNSLLRNDGKGHFTDVTEEAGLLSFHPTQTAAFADFDGDGDLDLFVGNESRGKDVNDSELFRNEGNGRFRNVTRETGLEIRRWVKAVSWGDIDNDGDPDLYVSCLGSDNLLFRNDGMKKTDGGKKRWVFTEIAGDAGVREPRWSFPCWFFDYDNDGDLDLYVLSFDEKQALKDVCAVYLGREGTCETPRLYRNDGSGHFENVTRPLGSGKPRLAMGSNFDDLDGDGWLDIYVGTGEPTLRTLVPNVFLKNVDGRFLDATTDAGLGHLQKGHGVAFADFDNDGDLDLYETLGGAFFGDRYTNALFLNPGSGHRQITLQFEGTKSNRCASGIRFAVRITEKGGSTRLLHRVVGSGGSFGSSSFRQEIGLGHSKGPVDVSVTWTSGTVQVWNKLSPDRAWRLVEGKKDPIPVSLPRIDMAALLGEKDRK